MPDLLFIFTYINRNTVDTLLESILLNRNIRLGVIAVAQNNILMDLSPYESEYTRIWSLTIPGQLNSSAARNVGIEFVRQHNITSRYVMFPDDDSSFDAKFFEQFNQEIRLPFCYLTDVYETGTKKYFQHIRTKVDEPINSTYWNSVGAVNMIISYDVFCCTGKFDENMGVAARYGGGEDGDYFIRSLTEGAEYRYTSQIYSYHPSGRNKYKHMSYKQILKRFKSYGIGVEYLLVKHKMYKSAIYICIKAFLGGCLNLLTFRPKLASVYFYAFYIRVYSLTKFLFFTDNDNCKYCNVQNKPPGVGHSVEMRD